MIALLLSGVLAAGHFEHSAADGGYPEVTLIETGAPTTSMVLSFGTGYGDDFGLVGLSAQTQTALTQANAALPIKKWTELAFTGAVELTMSMGRYQTHFVLTAPKDSFEEAAKLLVPALLSPRLDRRLFEALAGRASPTGRAASESELIIQWLEPLILEDPKEAQRGKVVWHDFARVQQHVDELISPGNAVITVVGGFDPVKLRALLTRAHRGKPRLIRRPATLTDVHRELPSLMSVHVFGYPLPELSTAQVAALRVLNRLLYERLTTQLREQGHAYSISVHPQVTPWFDGLLMVVPAFDAFGADLEPILVENISKVVHAQLEPAELERLVAAVKLEDELSFAQPELLTRDLVGGRRKAAWLGPEYREALSALTPQSVLKASSDLLVNERRRFYVRFMPSPGQAKGRGP